MQDETKKSILKEARKSFLHFGYAKSSMNNIAIACGKKKSALYYYFPGKEELFEAVIAEEYARLFKKIQQNGLEPCSGGIFGVGESEKDWISLAFQLRELGIQSIPINALSPIAGTPFQARCKLEPEQMLKIVALFRLIHPTARLIIAGGREMTMGDRQEELFTAGASGILIGNYLTTPGRPAEEDQAMLEKLGLCGEPEKITVR